MYYVYALLDTRKPGPFRYGKWKFDYEPFYVGKGKDLRAFKHLNQTPNTCSNLHKLRKIAKIQRETGAEPMVVLKRKNLSEAEALILEVQLITLIGRSDRKSGPLTNLTDGGEGTSNRSYSKETRKKLSESNKRTWATKPEGKEYLRQLRLKTPKQYRDELHASFPNVMLKSKYVDVRTKLEFKCRVCKHTWSVKPMYCVSHGCPSCRKHDPELQAASRERRSAAVKAVHAARPTLVKRAIAEKIGKAQTDAWVAGTHGAAYYSEARKAEIREKRSASIKSYCAANPDKKRDAAIKSHITRKAI